MSEIMNNLVTALNGVRSEYNDRLRTVPQYEAFLMVETSTQRAFDALRELLNASKPSMAGEVIASLENAKSTFKQHLHSLAEYRALLAIDKLIGDVSSDAEEPPATIAATADAAPSQQVAAAQPELEMTSATAVTADTVARPELIGVEPDPVAAVAVSPSITPSVNAEVASTQQAFTDGSGISLADLAHAISQPEALAESPGAHETEPDPPYGLPPIETANAETAAVVTGSTPHDAAATETVADRASDTSVDASSELRPATPSHPDDPTAEQAA